MKYWYFYDDHTVSKFDTLRDALATLYGEIVQGGRHGAVVHTPVTEYAVIGDYGKTHVICYPRDNKARIVTVDGSILSRAQSEEILGY